MAKQNDYLGVTAALQYASTRNRGNSMRTRKQRKNRVTRIGSCCWELVVTCGKRDIYLPLFLRS